MPSEQSLRQLLTRVANGELEVDRALDSLRDLPYEQIDIATLDHHRAIRNGFGEVVYCEGKTSAQVAEILSRLAQVNSQVLATRATREQFEAVRVRVPEFQFESTARAIALDREPDRVRLHGVTIVTAGTSDLAVAEEASLTLKLMGHTAQRITDVGVAGIHRLLDQRHALQSANVIVAVAGMDGALPSVIAGLVRAPVIAVPTSVGYGTGIHGLAALMTMLNSCAAGIGVVNIDNGFGAGFLAGTINQRIHEGHEQRD